MVKDLLREDNYFDKDVIAAVKHLVLNKARTLFGELRYAFLRMCYNRAQTASSQSFLKLLNRGRWKCYVHEDVIRENWNEKNANVSNTEAECNGLSKKPLTSSSYIAPISKAVGRKMEPFIRSKKIVSGKASKQAQTTAAGTYHKVID